MPPTASAPAPAISLRLRNQTSGSDTVWTLNSIVEWGPRGLVLELPTRAVSLNQYLEGQLQLSSPSEPPLQLDFTAKAVAVAPLDTLVLKVTAELAQFDKGQWTALNARLGKQQTELQRSLEEARGLEAPPAQVTPKMQDTLRAFLQAQRVLIADTSQGAANAMADLLIQLGARPDQVVSTTVFELAATTPEPGLIVADFDLDKKRGIDLLRALRKAAQSKKPITLLTAMTGNQAALAKAVEEDIDAIVIKPLSIELIKTILLKSIAAAVAPSDYRACIEQGYQDLAKGATAEAEAKFSRALELSQEPAAAHAGLGFVHQKLKKTTEAEAAFKAALKINKRHLRSLEGLAEVLISRSAMTEAYEVLKRTTQYFPTNPARLSQTLRLAIQCNSYEDIEKISQVYDAMAYDDASLTRYVAAALITCGKHYLRQKTRSRALHLFSRAIQITQVHPRSIREIVLALLSEKQVADAKGFFSMLPKGTAKTPDYEAVQYALTEAEAEPQAVVRQGLELIAKGKDPLVYQILLRALVQTGENARANELRAEATAHWPEMAATFAAPAAAAAPGKPVSAKKSA